MAEKHCPDCKGVIPSGSTACQCGWQQSTSRNPSMPTIEDLYHDIAQVIARSKGKKVQQIESTGPMDAARFLVRVLLCSHELPGPQKKSDAKGSEYWGWTARQTIRQLAARFLSLPVADQRYIIAAYEDGIQWRGDEMPFFHTVIDETLKMREMGADAYRKESNKRLLEFAGQCRSEAKDKQLAA